MLQCTVCNVIVKNDLIWKKHIKTLEHLEGIKHLKEKCISKKQIDSECKDQNKLLEEKEISPTEKAQNEINRDQKNEDFNINKNSYIIKLLKEEPKQNLKLPDVKIALKNLGIFR